RMHRGVAPKRSARKLAATVGDHLVDVHVELGATSRHPDMQWKHVVVLPGEDFVAGLSDQFVTLIVEPLARVVCSSGGLLQDRVGGDHFAGDQIRADAEMLEGALGLRTPELVRRHLDHAEAVSLLSHAGHMISPRFSGCSTCAGAGQVATSTTAWAKSCGASWGRLCPMPPLMVRCAYLPTNLWV